MFGQFNENTHYSHRFPKMALSMNLICIPANTTSLNFILTIKIYTCFKIKFGALNLLNCNSKNRKVLKNKRIIYSKTVYQSLLRANITVRSRASLVTNGVVYWLLIWIPTIELSKNNKWTNIKWVYIVVNLSLIIMFQNKTCD